MNDMTESRRTFLSIVMALCAFFMFSCADVLQKYLGVERGYSVNELLAYPALVSFCIAFIWVVFKKGLKGLAPHNSKFYHLLRIFFMVIGSYFIVSGVQLIPLAQFYGIIFALPFLVAVGGVFFFGEHPGPWRWSAILLGFAGVWIAANPDFNGISEGIIYTILAAIFLGGSHLTVRKIGPGEYTPLFPLYLHIVIFAINLAIILPDYTFPQTGDIPLFLLCGIFLFAAVILVSAAVSMTPLVSIVMPFQYSQILFGILFGLFIFQEVPTTRTLIGLSVIVIAGLMMVWGEYKAAKKRLPILEH